jgi:hypothetical protein
VFQQPARPFGQFTVSPDGNWLAADFRDKDKVSLMIMEHFR